MYVNFTVFNETGFHSSDNIDHASLYAGETGSGNAIVTVDLAVSEAVYVPSTYAGARSALQSAFDSLVDQRIAA